MDSRSAALAQHSADEAWSQRMRWVPDTASERMEGALWRHRAMWALFGWIAIVSQIFRVIHVDSW